MQPTPLCADGHNGQIEFDGRFVTITRRGVFARATVGQGEKRIPIGQVTAVQWKKPGRFINGYIEFSLAGGREVRSRAGSQTADQTRNENAVIVTRAQEPQFQALREAVEAAIAAHDAPASGGDLGAQLQQLSELHAQGALSDAEFQAAKARLLGT